MKPYMLYVQSISATESSAFYLLAVLWSVVNLLCWKMYSKLFYFCLLFSLVFKGNFGRFFFCIDPGTPQNTARSTQFGVVYKFYIGSTIEYNCTSGYVMRGSPTITCKLLISHPFVVVGWQPALPQCISE